MSSTMSYLGILMGNQKLTLRRLRVGNGWTWILIKKDLEEHPEIYTAWFRIIFNRFFDHIRQDKG